MKSFNALELSPNVRVQYLIERTAFRTRLESLRREFDSSLHPWIDYSRNYEVDGVVTITVWSEMVRRYGLLFMLNINEVLAFEQALRDQVLRDTNYLLMDISRSDIAKTWAFSPDPDYFATLEAKEAVAIVVGSVADKLRQSDRLNPQNYERNSDR